MKALTITNVQITQERLLEMADSVEGAWIGIRISALLLLLSGWKSTSIASLFGLSRWSVVKWIQRANKEGVSAVQDKDRPGRPSRITDECRRDLDKALERSPNEFGIARARWDGKVVVQYLKEYHGITKKVRRAQQLLHELGYSLKRPTHRYIQASKKGVKGFRISLKKTPNDSEGS